MITELLRRLHLEHYLNADEQKLLEDRVFTLAGWSTLNALCHISAASKDFRTEEDGQIKDQERLRRVQELYLKEIDRINVLVFLGINMGGSLREDELDKKRSQVRQEIRGRWKNMREHLSRGEFWMQMRDILVGELKDAPSVVQTLSEIQSTLSSMGNEVHPAIHAALSELQAEGLDVDEEHAFIMSIWQEYLMVQLPAHPEQMAHVLSDLHDVFSVFIENNTAVDSLVGSLPEGDKQLESAQYLQMMTVDDLQAIKKLLGSEGFANREQITAILLEALAKRCHLALPERGFTFFSAALQNYCLSSSSALNHSSEQFMLFLSTYQGEAQEQSEDGQQEDLFKQRIPRPGTKQYSQYLQKIVSSGIAFVQKRSEAENVFLPDASSESLIHDAQLERIINGAMRYDTLLKSLLSPSLRGRVAQWSVPQVYAACIIVKLERHAESGNGFRNINKDKFVADLLASIEQSVRGEQ